MTNRACHTCGTTTHRTDTYWSASGSITLCDACLFAEMPTCGPAANDPRIYVDPHGSEYDMPTYSA